jgi:uncharacterized membrane protein
MKVTTHFGKVLKTLGLMGIMMALAGLLVQAPAASAASASASKFRTVAAPGKLSVYVAIPTTADKLPTIYVAVMDSKGNVVAKGTADSNNSYSTALAPDVYKVQVDAEGYKSSAVETKVASGQASAVKVALESNAPAPAPEPVPVATAVVAQPESGKLLVQISDDRMGATVPSATVIIYDAKGNGVVKGSTDNAGNFGTVLEAGSYKLQVTADGYRDYSQAIEIVSGQMTEAKVSLSSAAADTDPFIGPALFR